MELFLYDGDVSIFFSKTFYYCKAPLNSWDGHYINHNDDDDDDDDHVILALPIFFVNTNRYLHSKVAIKIHTNPSFTLTLLCFKQPGLIVLSCNISGTSRESVVSSLVPRLYGSVKPGPYCESQIPPQISRGQQLKIARLGIGLSGFYSLGAERFPRDIEVMIGFQFQNGGWFAGSIYRRLWYW